MQPGSRLEERLLGQLLPQINAFHRQQAHNHSLGGLDYTKTRRELPGFALSYANVSEQEYITVAIDSQLMEQMKKQSALPQPCRYLVVDVRWKAGPWSTYTAVDAVSPAYTPSAQDTHVAPSSPQFADPPVLIPPYPAIICASDTAEAANIDGYSVFAGVDYAVDVPSWGAIFGTSTDSTPTGETINSYLVDLERLSSDIMVLSVKACSQYFEYLEIFHPPYTAPGVWVPMPPEEVRVYIRPYYGGHMGVAEVHSYQENYTLTVYVNGAPEVSTGSTSSYTHTWVDKDTWVGGPKPLLVGTAHMPILRNSVGPIGPGSVVEVGRLTFDRNKLAGAFEVSEQA